jgi:hypothetical protein
LRGKAAESYMVANELAGTKGNIGLIEAKKCRGGRGLQAAMACHFEPDILGRH